MWLYVRQQLLDEMDTHRDAYRSIFENIQEDMYNLLYNSINWQQVQAAPFQYWMQMPYTRVLIAQRFDVIVQLINIKSSQTYFPLWRSAKSEAVNLHQVVPFVYVHNNHFFNIKLEGDYPMPSVTLDRAYASQTTTIYAIGALKPLKLHIEPYESEFEPKLSGSSFYAL
ncbi:hypothetical protein E3N88_23884 [Mikania micrantha]|uniref:Uncharacterized protein n=1 Tax=Mikania micrantha TaxID=192012 RepID=A0A5N6NG95_9ASTR|nr:hypothetical protein E3N88_23884 [Mikania micrantha]